MKKALYLFLLLVMITVSFWAGKHYTRPQAGGNASARRVLYYVDPMHPAYKSDKPGIAPDCGMKLVPVYADDPGEASGSSGHASAPGGVNISLDQQQLIGVRVVPVEKTSGVFKVRVLGRVTADETRVYRLNAATDGWIQTIFDNSTGSLVKKEQRLANFAALDLLVSQQSYIQAVIQSPERRPESKYEAANPVDWTIQSSRLAADRLRNLGMSDTQIRELAATRKVSDNIDIVSPVTGFILLRNVSPGQRFEKGAELYRIADLSHIWIVADLYENESQYFRPGVVATATLTNQGKSFPARVGSILPQFDPATRTMKLRLEANNPGFVLRPDMFVDVEVPVQVPAGLSVPAEALLDSGSKKRVFVDRGNGSFEPREVETGLRFGERVQIVKGLALGERVVVSGTFLLDSETRLKAAQQSTETVVDNHDAAMSQTKAKQADVRSTSASTTKKNVAKDPVCGMEVDPQESVAAGNTETYAGNTYYFCSKSCKSDFHNDPKHYLPANPEAARAASPGAKTGHGLAP